MTLTSSTVRASALRPAHPLPVVDEDRLLRLHDRWVALTDLQVPVVERLLDRLGSMVPLDDLRSAYGGAGGSTDDEAMRSLLHRIGRRLTAVGATVTFAPNRGGMMVTVSDTDLRGAVS
ncbi:MAG: hypothetical protein R2746_02785 [Acidimicrobiales bacterium]|nr:hypothetical protein [Actinomycetota bacterium]